MTKTEFKSALQRLGCKDISLESTNHKTLHVTYTDRYGDKEFKIVFTLWESLEDKLAEIKSEL